GTTTFSATFQVSGGATRLDFAAPSVSFALAPGEVGNKTVDLLTTDGSARPFTITGAPSWLGVSPLSGTTPATVTLTANSAGLSQGSFSATLTASSSAPGYLPDTLQVNLSVGSSGGCSP